MRIHLTLLVVGCAGCAQLFGLHDVPSDATATGDSLGPSDHGNDSPGCVGAGNYVVCADPQPSQSMTLTSLSASGASCMTGVSWQDPNQPAACFIVATDLTIPLGTTISGTSSTTLSRPLVLVATGTLTVAGTIDVASKSAGTAGAGANSSTCGSGTPPAAGDGGGGAGGSFMTAGGDGGGKDSTTSPGLSASADASAPTILRGGCPGQQGDGDGSASPPGGSGGNGGGAVYLVAGHEIEITGGTIDASGAGGVGGPDRGAGGGGGAGGMIVLIAPQGTATNATIFADGGGGGGGGVAGDPGGSGSDPDGQGAADGGASSCDGGSGEYMTTPAGPGSSSSSPQNNAPWPGGGGGGGGYITSSFSLAGASNTVSPAPQ